jgi:catechol 2,3-dioxygenase-like lactoylglutathione lyase family enzyme
MTTIADLHIGDDPVAWRSIGLDVDAGHIAHVGHVRLHFHGDSDQRGILSWTLAGTPDETVTDVDGLATAHGEPAALGGLGPSHLVGAQSIDHLVVLTPDIDRTVKAVERSLGLPLRRTRDAERDGYVMKQAFFRMGEVVLELVGGPEPDPAGGPARFGGIVFTVDSIEDAVELLGEDLVSEPKPAVQPGRLIATVRPGAGLAVPLALMSAEPGR